MFSYSAGLPETARAVQILVAEANMGTRYRLSTLMVATFVYSLSAPRVYSNPVEEHAREGFRAPSSGEASPRPEPRWISREPGPRSSDGWLRDPCADVALEPPLENGNVVIRASTPGQALRRPLRFSLGGENQARGNPSGWT